MSQYLVKVLLTAVLVVAIAEAAKRWTLLGAVIASLPLTSIMAMIWLYWDTNELAKVSDLSTGIFWVVIPSLVFFAAFPLFAKIADSFWVSMLSSIVVTALAYWAYIELLKKFKLI